MLIDRIQMVCHLVKLQVHDEIRGCEGGQHNMKKIRGYLFGQTVQYIIFWCKEH